MILLDTNVVSEPMKDAANQDVMRWLNLNFPDCAISSIVIFELHAGVVRLARGKRRKALEDAIERTIQRFGSRIFPFDGSAARSAAIAHASARSGGRTIQTADIQTAGIAIANGLRLATRNVRDFAGLGVDLVDPWKAP
jgi:predicted nucleic acid-binding protein